MERLNLNPNWWFGMMLDSFDSGSSLLEYFFKYFSERGEERDWSMERWDIRNSGV